MNRFATLLAGTVLLVLSAAARAELRVNGVDAALADNILAFSRLRSEPCDAPRWRVRRRFRELDDDVRDALQPFGYYGATIDKALTFDDDCWAAALTVAAGDPVRIDGLDLGLSGAGSDDPFLARVLGRSGLVRGEPLYHPHYTALKRELQSAAADRGYFAADFAESRIDIYPDEHRADVTLDYATGARFRFGEVRLEQTVLEPAFIQSYVRIEPGDPYSAEALAELQQSLSGSGYFAGADVSPSIPADAAAPVDIDVRLAPAQRLSYSAGAGFSTDTGPRLRGGYENRRVNSRGHKLNGDLLYSPVISELSATYRRPLAQPDVEWLSYSAGLKTEDTDTSDSERASLGLRRVARLSRGWLRNEALTLQFDRFRVGDVDDNSRLLMPSIGFSRKRADRDINPDRGHSLSLELRGASEALGSTTSFAQFLASARLIRPLGDGGRLLLRAAGGITFKDALRDLPPDVRFFAGGNDSVRGFGYETLGPEDDSGTVVGGSHLLTASIEYDRLLFGNFAWAAFVDGGNAFDDTSIDPRYAAGLGLKWRSPIGPVRVYLAHPLNLSERSVRLHVSIGPDL